MIGREAKKPDAGTKLPKTGIQTVERIVEMHLKQAMDQMTAEMDRDLLNALSEQAKGD